MERKKLWDGKATEEEIMFKTPDLEFCPFSSHHLDLPFYPQICLSYLKVICACPCGPSEAFGDLQSPKTLQ